MISKGMKMGAVENATRTIKEQWEALGYRVETKPSGIYTMEIEVYDGEVYLDTLVVTIRRKVK